MPTENRGAAAPLYLFILHKGGYNYDYHRGDK